MIRGFTLFEVIISLVIFSVVLLSLMNLFKADDQLKTYYKLIELENNYRENGIVNSTDTIILNQ